MIKNPISVKIGFLKNIHHDAFIGNDTRELHLWDASKLKKTLERMQQYGVQFGSIIKHGDKDATFYIITF